jgi:hypothetical protein
MESCLVAWHKNRFQNNNMVAIAFGVDYRNISTMTLGFLPQ